MAHQYSDGNHDPSLFQNAVHHMQNQNYSGGINEQDALDAHQQVYQQGGQGGVSANTIGSAAGLQALKKLVGGGASGGSGGGNWHLEKRIDE